MPIFLITSQFIAQLLFEIPDDLLKIQTKERIRKF